MLPPAAPEFQRLRRRRVAATVAVVRRQWQTMGEDLDASWARVSAQVAAIVAASQTGTAVEAEDYVPRVLAQQGMTAPTGQPLAPGRFSGAYSADSLAVGSLEPVLYSAVVHARTAAADTLPDRLAVGGAWLDRFVADQVVAASAAATSAAISARPSVGWLRVEPPPSCQRCAPLAGKFFRSNAGFARHPQCDGYHLPSTRGSDDPDLAIKVDDIRDLTSSQRRAIDAGADLNQVVNAHRVDVMADGSYVSARTSDGLLTTAGGLRPTPLGIYRVAEDEADAVRLLREYGYFTT